MIKKSEFMQNRELSWLRFNLRVLQEADDPSVAILERLKFISIFTTNLDEFFMVRVGSIRDLMLLKKDTIDIRTGMTPEQQLEAIYSLMPMMYETRDRLYRKNTEDLKEYGINKRQINELTEIQLKHVEDYYNLQIMPLLSPQIVNSSHPLPFLENKRLYVILKLKDDNGEIIFGLVPISKDFETYLTLPGDQFDYIRLERVIFEYVDSLFGNRKVLAKNIISVTRNFDVDETSDFAEEFEDYKDHMKKILKKRQRKEIVRLEIYGDKDKALYDFLLSELNIPKEWTVYTDAPINLSYVYKLSDMLPSALLEKVSYRPFKPRRHSNCDKCLMNLIEQQDLFYSYPFDDMENFLDVIKEAVEDDRVQSIKITIYRLASNSKLVDYLIKGAERGIDITVLMELKARFDEENNINYSDKLYNAGCHILYGFEEYKTHSKLCLITYKDDRDNIKFITQIGTGNYNEQTSKIYSDFSLITANREIGMDANDFFKNMQTERHLEGKYLHLLQSPTTLKPRFLRLIDQEIAKGSDGYLRFKMNSLTDISFINKFQEASAAGVKIDLIIRGICCIIPGVEGFTENINVRSIVGRFLEHARVYQFGKGEDMMLYISSADLMTRNTERRVEIAAPVYDERIRNKLLEFMDMQMQDNVKARIIGPDGEYKIIDDGKTPFDSQQYYIEQTEAKIERDYECKNAEKNNQEKQGLKSWFDKFFN